VVAVAENWVIGFQGTADRRLQGSWAELVALTEVIPRMWANWERSDEPEGQEIPVAPELAPGGRAEAIKDFDVYARQP
jgi:hypothetical protein